MKIVKNIYMINWNYYKINYEIIKIKEDDYKVYGIQILN